MLDGRLQTTVRDMRTSPGVPTFGRRVGESGGSRSGGRSMSGPKLAQAWGVLGGRWSRCQVQTGELWTPHQPPPPCPHHRRRVGLQPSRRPPHPRCHHQHHILAKISNFSLHLKLLLPPIDASEESDSSCGETALVCRVVRDPLALQCRCSCVRVKVNP